MKRAPYTTTRYSSIVFGVRSVLEETDGGEFHCPCCRATCSYERRVLSNIVIFLFIPFHTRTDEHVVCLECDTIFPPGIEALSGQEAVERFESLYDRVLVAAMAVMTAGKEGSSIERARELLAMRLQRPSAQRERRVALERPLDSLCACDPTKLPLFSRREILSAVYEWAQREGFDWDVNERLGEIIDALGLPSDELVRAK